MIRISQGPVVNEVARVSSQEEAMEAIREHMSRRWKGEAQVTVSRDGLTYVAKTGSIFVHYRAKEA